MLHTSDRSSGSSEVGSVEVLTVAVIDEAIETLDERDLKAHRRSDLTVLVGFVAAVAVGNH